MHSRELAELAALLAIHAPTIVQSPGRLPHSVSEQYWAASKCRLDRWGRLLRSLAAAADEPQPSAALAWPRVRPALEEILISELLTRLWTALAAAHDAARGDQDVEPIARNIFSGHQEARRRLLALVADARGIQLAHAVELNQLRRRVERWTDMLLAHLADCVAIDEFAFEPERARDFADDLDHEAAAADRRFTSQLVVASLRGSFARGLAEISPNLDLNRRIGGALLAAFPDAIADAFGPVKSLWLIRLSRMASDTESMIDELLRLDAGHAISPLH